MNRVKCPNCSKGWDYTGEGVCGFCVYKPLRPVNGFLEEEDDLLMWPAWVAARDAAREQRQLFAEMADAAWQRKDQNANPS